MKKKVLIPMFILLVITGIAFYFGNTQQFKGNAAGSQSEECTALTIEQVSDIDNGSAGFQITKEGDTGTAHDLVVTVYSGGGTLSSFETNANLSEDAQTLYLSIEDTASFIYTISAGYATIVDDTLRAYVENNIGTKICKNTVVVQETISESEDDSADSGTGTTLNSEQYNDELDYAEIDWEGTAEGTAEDTAEYTLGKWHLTSDADTVVAIPEDGSELYIGDPANGVLLTDYFDITVTATFGQFSEDTGEFTTPYTTSTGSIFGPWYFAPDWNYFFEITGMPKATIGMEDTFDASGAAGEEVNWQVDEIDFLSYEVSYAGGTAYANIETYVDLYKIYLSDSTKIIPTEYPYSSNTEYYNFETENYSSGGYVIGTKGDADGDGISDIIEKQRLKTDPYDADSNDDGIEDGEEDSDGDGPTNAEEIENGTDPIVADSSTGTTTTTYVLNLSAMDAYGNPLTGLDATAFSASTTDGGTSEITDVAESSGTYTLYIPSSTTYYVSVANDGYVTADDSFASVDSTSTTVESVYLNYAYYIDLDDANGTYVSGATILAGDSSAITCVDSSSYVTDDANKGFYGCAVPLSGTGLTYSVSAKGYQDFDGEFDSDRTSATDAAVTETVTLTTDEDTEDDSDVDEDGISNILEIRKFGYDPDDTDSDDDGTEDGDEDYDLDDLTNLEEINTYLTDPILDDTDGDGYLDGEEITNGTDPLVADAEDEEEDDSDVDGDGLANVLEIKKFGYDPDDVDSDDDGTEDGDEDYDSDGLTNLEELDTYETSPFESDSDEDGTDDGDEITNGTDPLVGDDEEEDPDYDDDGLTNDDETDTYETDPYDDDSDDDEVSDYEEIMTFETDPNDEDSDGDGFDDGYEIEKETDPLDDTDYPKTKRIAEESDSPFTDIVDHWSEDYVNALYEEGIVSGRSATLYEPDDDVTRAEFLKMIMLVAGLDPTYHTGLTVTKYSDVNPGDWYYDYVALADSYGDLWYAGSGTWQPNENITRGDAILLVMRIANQTLYDFTEEDSSFTDFDEDSYQAYAIILAEQYEIITGYDDGEFKPDNSITRAEAAVVVSKSEAALF